MTDVLGFIEGKNKVGWLLIVMLKNCQHTFDKYHNVYTELCKRFNQGESVELNMQICLIGEDFFTNFYYTNANGTKNGMINVF